MSRTAGLKKLSAISASLLDTAGEPNSTNVVGHEDRIDVAPATPVVLLAIALLPEAEHLIERDRGFVVRKHVQLKLAHAGAARPYHGLAEQGAADPASAMGGRDHQAEIGDVPAGRMRIAPERQASDDAFIRFGNEDGRVAVAAESAQVAPLIRGRTPAAV